jgi:8-oxo-dGTP pyrophosphatase MutT (NUDIX family)
MITAQKIPEFGTHRENEERRDGGLGIVFDPKTKLFAAAQKPDGHYLLFGGGVPAGEDSQVGTLREVTEESGLIDFLKVEPLGQATAHYYHSTKKVNRVTLVSCFLVILKSTATRPVQHEPHEQFELVWVSPQKLLNAIMPLNKNGDYGHWIYFFDKALKRLEELGYNTKAQD